MRIDTIWIAEFASAGWLESLGNYIDEEDRASFISVTEKINVFQGNLYAIPWNANIGLLYYRKDLLEKYNMNPPTRGKNSLRYAQKSQFLNLFTGISGRENNTKDWCVILLNLLAVTTVE